MKVETYALFAANGKYIRKATKVVLEDGREIRFHAGRRPAFERRVTPSQSRPSPSARPGVGATDQA